MPPIVKLLRPHQYAKNLLVFAAPGAAGRLDEASVVGWSLLAFVLFCAASSAGYVVNDMLDAEADRLHPVKQHRPIASGAVSQRQASIALAALGVGAIGLATLLGASFVAVLVGYAAVSMSYSIVFKRIPWLELLFVSAGFVLRAIGGGAATDTPLSWWFLLVVSAGALLMILGKRIGELVALGAESASRKVLSGYRLEHLRGLTAVASALAVGGYGAWAAAEAEDQVADSKAALHVRRINMVCSAARALTIIRE